MPYFAHLPLILAPEGTGKLSKRHGKKFGFPVFPLSWEAEKEEDSFTGFKDAGYLPHALVNFLAFLGWNPGTDQEMFSLAALIEAFSLDRINKSGARFDIVKAKWYNQQYILKMSDESLAEEYAQMAKDAGKDVSADFALKYVRMFKERIEFLPELLNAGSFLAEDEVQDYDRKSVRKKWKGNAEEVLNGYLEVLAKEDNFEPVHLESFTKAYIEKNDLSFGALFPGLRLGLSGSLKGPSIFDMMEILGKEKSINRLKNAPAKFAAIKEEANG